MSNQQVGSLLMVCLGNICRSPSAQAVFRNRIAMAGFAVYVDSAGTGNWHVGEPPDERAAAAIAQRGLSGLMDTYRARQVCEEDFYRFTHILAMDKQNLKDLQDIRPEGGTKPRLLLDYWPQSPVQEVPDPYYGGAEGFERMLDLIEGAADAFVEARHASRPSYLD